MNGWTRTLAITAILGGCGYIASMLWTQHALVADHAARLLAIEGRADTARDVIDEVHVRLAQLERDVAVLRQRLEERP